MRSDIFLRRFESLKPYVVETPVNWAATGSSFPIYWRCSHDFVFILHPCVPQAIKAGP